MYLVSFDIVLEACITFRIQVISPHKNLLLSCRYCKWSYTCHYIADGFSGCKYLNKTSVLSIEPAVPVNLGVIETKNALLFPDFDIQVRLPSEKLVLKGTKSAFATDVGGFVNHCANCGVFV